MKKLLSLILALMLCMGAIPALAEAGVIGGADGPTSLILSEPGFILPGDLAVKALEAGRKGNTVVTVTEMTGINTGNPDIDAALTELIKALGFTFSEQGDEGAFALTISGKDVLTLGLAASDNSAYVNSNLLGGTIVISADEVEGLLSRLLDMLVLMEAVTAEDAAAAKEEMSWLIETISAAMQNGAFTATLTDADILALDYSAFDTVLAALMEKYQLVENIVVPRNCDPADSGVIMTANNEDMIAMSKAIIQFIKDNPKLMDYLASQIGFSTETQLDAVWDVYNKYGVFENEEQFRADGNVSFEELLDEVMAELDGKKILDGEMVFTCYFDEEVIPVYATMTLPLFMEAETLYTEVQPEFTEPAATGDGEIIASPSADMLAETEPQGETVVVDLVYTRQTVAQGVSHVFNLSANEDTMTIDTLVNGSTAHIVISTPEAEPVIIDATVEGNQLTAVLTSNPDEETTITCNLEGSYLYTDTKYLLTGKLTMTEVFTPEEAEAPSINGLTLPGFDSYKPKAKTNTIVLDISADYDLNGVDFTGVSKVAFSYNDVHVALQMDSYTSDPADSIIAGNVVRPAELDDAAFANWFVGVINTINSWVGNLLMALPESVLTLLVSSGMF